MINKNATEIQRVYRGHKGRAKKNKIQKNSWNERMQNKVNLNLKKVYNFHIGRETENNLGKSTKTSSKSDKYNKQLQIQLQAQLFDHLDQELKDVEIRTFFPIK